MRPVSVVIYGNLLKIYGKLTRILDNHAREIGCAYLEDALKGPYVRVRLRSGNSGGNLAQAVLVGGEVRGVLALEIHLHHQLPPLVRHTSHRLQKPTPA